MNTTKAKTNIQPRASVAPNNQSNPGYMSIKSLTDEGIEGIKALFPSFSDGGYEGCLREAGGVDLLRFDVIKGGECGDQPQLAWVTVRPWMGEAYASDEVDEVDVHIEHRYGGIVPDHFEITVETREDRASCPCPITGRPTPLRYRFSIPTTRKQGRRLDARRIAARALSLILA